MRPVSVVLALCALAVLAFAGCGAPAERATPSASLSVTDLLGGAAEEGYARASGSREFTFPEDHGPHPEYKTEWWYFTGNLDDAQGRRFGFQLTFFRSAVDPEPVARDRSHWSTRQVYMAHFALTDATGERFFAEERFARGALGLAGAGGAPFGVWVEDWSVRSTGSGPGDATWPVALGAAGDGYGLALRLEPGKPLVLQGDAGYSRKGAAAGNASYYYSFTRLQATGEVTVKGETFAVSGHAWLDREWSTSVLEAGQVGWDWFALQLDDGRELMLYRLRRDDGRADPYSYAVLVDAGGRKTLLEEFAIEQLERWESPRTGARYPVAWRLTSARLPLDLHVEALLSAQELALAVTYWEGAVAVRGQVGDAAVTGRGYAELTGYDAASRSHDRSRTGW
jgi:predicted secreted hydrolase